MLNRITSLAGSVSIGMVVVLLLTPALAEEGVQDGETYRLLLTNGKQVVGEVLELEGVYKVTVSSGITVTLKKSQVRELTPVDALESDASSGRRAITDAEIAEILGSEQLDELELWAFVEAVNLLKALPTNPENLELMLRIAGRAAQIYETEHFVLVYTSTLSKAKRLAARLETVYKWRVWFLERVGVAPIRPDHKFEMFFFGTYDEFEAYQALHGNVSPGVLGFWNPDDNRSAFFDCDDYPPIAAALQRYADPEVPLRIRRRGNNLVARWVENYNLEVVQHEAGHHIDFNIGFFPGHGDVPRWLPEGFTQLFEVPPSRLGASYGSVNYKKLNELRQIYGPELQNLPSLRDFMLRNELWFEGYNYPLGWALVHYLVKEYRDDFARFMQLIAQREDDRGVIVPLAEKLEQLEELFGEIDDEWTQRFKDYMNAIPMRQSALPPAFADFP